MLTAVATIAQGMEDISLENQALFLFRFCRTETLKIKIANQLVITARKMGKKRGVLPSLLSANRCISRMLADAIAQDGISQFIFSSQRLPSPACMKRSGIHVRVHGFVMCRVEINMVALRFHQSFSVPSFDIS